MPPGRSPVCRWPCCPGTCRGIPGRFQLTGRRGRKPSPPARGSSPCGWPRRRLDPASLGSGTRIAFRFSPCPPGGRVGYCQSASGRLAFGPIPGHHDAGIGAVRPSPSACTELTGRRPAGCAWPRDLRALVARKLRPLAAVGPAEVLEPVPSREWFTLSPCHLTSPPGDTPEGVQRPGACAPGAREGSRLHGTPFQGHKPA
jgi:hypothetical protein